MKLPKMSALSEIVTVLTAIIGVTYYIFHLDARLSNLEIRVEKLTNKQQNKGETNSVLSEKTVSYIDNRDGTITDKQSNLMWKKCSEGQLYNKKENTCAEGLTKYYKWKEANEISTNFANYSDWRVPDLRELSTLIWCSNGALVSDYGCGGENNNKKEYKSPTIDMTVFPYTDKGKYISSKITNYKKHNIYWFRLFSNGNQAGYSTDDILGSVRLVRYNK